jgi:hypothetical protein
MDDANKYAIQMLQQEADELATGGTAAPQQMDMDRAFLQTFALSLVGENFATTRQVPPETIAHVAADESTYQEFKQYLTTKRLGQVDLSQHPDFLKILQAVVDAVDAQRQDKTGIKAS